MIAIEERRITIQGEDPIPAILLLPATEGPHPVVVVLHGQGASKDTWAPRVRPVVERGLAAVLIDSQLHGERALPGVDLDRPIPVLDHLAMLEGTARDVVATIDHLRSFSRLRGDRVALRGFSLGGQIALLAAARDRRLDPILAVGASLTFGPLDAGRYPASRPDPERLRTAVARVDLGPAAEDRVRAVAGRRLLFVHGLFDQSCPLSRVHDLTTRLAPHYAGGPGGLSLLVYAGDHHPPADVEALAWDWLVRNALERE